MSLKITSRFILPKTPIPYSLFPIPCSLPNPTNLNDVHFIILPEPIQPVIFSTMALHQDLAKNDYEVSLLQMKHNISSQEKEQRIRNVKSSVAEEKTTSAKTIMAITNTMIGSSVIVYPTLFIQDGLISSFLMMLVVGVVQYWTCRILCLHNKPEELDVNDTILRILGPKWYKASLTTNVLLLYIVCIVYFLLIGQNFYELTSAFLEAVSDYVAPAASTITFSTYSSQWAGVIIMVACGGSLFLKNINTLLKYLKYTAYAVFAYMIFVGVFAIKVMATKEIHWDDYILFSNDFSNVAGAFALSFTIHPVISPLIKKNLDQTKNNRDLFLGYVMTSLVYSFVGLVGAITCGKVVRNVIDDNYQTIFQCFPKELTGPNIEYIISKFIQTGILLQNMSVFPILSFLTRKQFLEIVDKNNNSPKVSLGFTISLILAALTIHILNVNVTIAISFDGAIIGFVLVYLIPICMHLKCVYHKYSDTENKDRINSLYGSDTSLIMVNLDSPEVLECVHKTKPNKLRDGVIYSVVGAFGVAMGVFKIYSFISS